MRSVAILRLIAVALLVQGSAEPADHPRTTCIYNKHADSNVAPL
jgi:hypothetical protein